MLHFKSVA